MGSNMVPFALSACRLFPLGFLARDRFFNGHGMSCVGTPVLWDSKQIGEYGYLCTTVGTLHQELLELLLT